MLRRSMENREVNQHAQGALVSRFHHPLKLADIAIQRVNVLKIRYVEPMILPRRRKNRKDRQSREPEILDVSEILFQAA
jgi:hypothetical protein